MTSDPGDMTRIGPHCCAHRSADAIAQELDGETVIMDLTSESYFGLNETGTFIWNQLDGSSTPSEIVDRLASIYDVSHAELLRDCLELLTLLLDAGLVELSSEVSTR